MPLYEYECTTLPQTHGKDPEVLRSRDHRLPPLQRDISSASSPRRQSPSKAADGTPMDTATPSRSLRRLRQVATRRDKARHRPELAARLRPRLCTGRLASSCGSPSSSSSTRSSSARRRPVFVHIFDTIRASSSSARGGTFLPSLRASDRPMAIACLRLVTFFPLRPLFSLPCFIACISRSTSLPADGLYLRVDFFAAFFAGAFFAALFFAAVFFAYCLLACRFLRCLLRCHNYPPASSEGIVVA